MEQNNNQKQRLEQAKKRVRIVKLFYIHFAGYLVFAALLIYNLYIVEEHYRKVITVLNLSILFIWTIFIIIHGLRAFRGRLLFKKDWEQKKMEDFLKDEDKEEEITFWE